MVAMMRPLLERIFCKWLWRCCSWFITNQMFFDSATRLQQGCLAGIVNNNQKNQVKSACSTPTVYVWDGMRVLTCVSISWPRINPIFRVMPSGWVWWFLQWRWPLCSLHALAMMRSAISCICGGKKVSQEAQSPLNGMLLNPGWLPSRLIAHELIGAWGGGPSRASNGRNWRFLYLPTPCFPSVLIGRLCVCALEVNGTKQERPLAFGQNCQPSL